MVKRMVKLIFPADLVTQPIIYQLGHEFKVVTNIKSANVLKDSGWVILELSGEAEEIEKAIVSLCSKGVKVEEI